MATKFNLNEILKADEREPILEVEFKDRTWYLYPMDFLPETNYLQAKQAEAQESQAIADHFKQIDPEVLKEEFNRVSDCNLIEECKIGDRQISVNFSGQPYAVDSAFFIEEDNQQYTIKEIQQLDSGHQITVEPAITTNLPASGRIVSQSGMNRIQAKFLSANYAAMPAIEAATVIPRRKQVEALLGMPLNTLKDVPPFAVSKLYEGIKKAIEADDKAKAEKAKAEADAKAQAEAEALAEAEKGKPKSSAQQKPSTNTTKQLEDASQSSDAVTV